MKNFLNNFNANFLGLFGIIWSNLTVLYPPTYDPDLWLLSLHFGIWCIWASLLLKFYRWIKNRIKPVSYKTYKGRYPRRNFLNYLSMFLICDIIGWHTWTSKSLQDIALTQEDVDAGEDGFWHYMRLYCNRCDCDSEFNPPTKFKPGNEVKEKNNPQRKEGA